MLELAFSVESAAAVDFAAEPMLAFKLRIANSAQERAIHTIALRCQIQIDASRRRYTPQEQRNIIDLFGEPDRWSHTLRSLLWTHASVVVPSFMSEAHVDLSVPCTFDFNVAATKYFAGLTDGDIPLRFLFSGTVFYADENDMLQVAPISWQQEAAFRLPHAIWQQMMDHHYPNCAWLRLRRDVFDRLCQYKTRHGIPTWEQVMERMLPVEETLPS